MQVGIEVLLKIPPENRREFIQSFKVLPQYNSCRDNCVFHMLLEDVSEMNLFLWVEHWVDKKALEKYLQYSPFSPLLIQPCLRQPWLPDFSKNFLRPDMNWYSLI